MNLLELSVLGAAGTWLLTKYLTNTELVGPFNIFENIRSFAGVERIEIPSAGEGGLFYTFQSNGSFWAEIFSCPYCTAPYMGVIVTLIMLLTGIAPLSLSLFMLWFGSVALATAFVRLTDG